MLWGVGSIYFVFSFGGIMQTVTTKRVSNGLFDVYLDGNVTRFYIINGDLGCSGLGGNTYGIRDLETDKITWIGSLARCKKTVAIWLTKDFSKSK